MADTTFLLASKSANTKAFAALKPKVLSTKSDIRHALETARRNDLWIAKTKRSLEQLLDVAQGPLGTIGVLLAPASPPPADLALLAGMFARSFFKDKHRVALDDEQLADVLGAENKADLFIAGFVDKQRKRLVLWRGDLSSLVCPLSIFKQAPSGPAPDENKFAITDHGQTLKFGQYEASAHSVLYEFDADYRRRAKKRQVKLAKGLGPSLRRLRNLKGLSQEHFSPISAKTVARIEKGECKPREKTIRALAKRLGVQPDEIESF